MVKKGGVSGVQGVLRAGVAMITAMGSPVFRQVILSLFFLLASGCSQKGGSDELIASWKDFVQLKVRQFEELDELRARKFAAGDTNARESYAVSGDLKKSDSVLTPFVGVLRIVDDWKAPTGNMKVVWTCEFTHDGQSWMAKGGEKLTSEAGKSQEKESLTADDIDSFLRVMDKDAAFLRKKYPR
jgi:hypothetical protein